MGDDSRDLKGWNPAAIAVFHESKAALQLLLNHGADPYLKSSYNKSAWDLAQDNMDAAGRVVKSRCQASAEMLLSRRWKVLGYPVTKQCFFAAPTFASRSRVMCCDFDLCKERCCPHCSSR